MKRVVLTAIALAVPLTACAQWSESFDSYVTGSDLHGQGGWQGWDDNPAAGALTTSAQSITSPNSVRIAGTADLVQPFSGINSGTWAFAGNLYFPSGQTGNAPRFILLNTYTTPHQTYHYSMEIYVSRTGRVFDVNRPEPAVDVHLDAWNEFLVIMNLSANTERTYINGQLLTSGPWKFTPQGALNFAALDLWADGNSGVYWDSFRLMNSRVYGHAILDGYLGQTDGYYLPVQVWQNGSLIETLDGKYGPMGAFHCSPSVSGDVVLKFHFRNGLWKAVGVNLGASPIENLQVTMPNGDCDLNNEVSIGDYALLSAAFGSFVGDANWDSNADLNGDDAVDIGDYSILSVNYGLFGD